MRNPDTTKEELLKNLNKSESEIRELKQVEINQKKILATLQLERELYADLANTLPAGIYRIRVFKDVSLSEDKWLSSNNAPYTVEFTNDRFFEILHMERVAFERNPAIINNYIFEDDKVDFARVNVLSNLKTIPFFWEGRLFVNDNVIWVNFKSVPRVMDNGDILWTGTLDDISERKRIEEEIKFKNKELQKLNADKDVFMSILAHDLLNPFNSILGYLDVLVTNVRDFDIDLIEKQLLVVNNSAQSAFYLLKDILIWARSQSGRLPFQPKHFSFNDCCENVVEVLKPIANNKNITIDIGNKEHITVFADINMMSTILRNLISNAIKFTNNGGCINIYAQQNDSSTTISVCDNGIGMPPEFSSKLFDIIKIYSTKGTANESGTGLGILLCKEFVEKHSGRIWVDSEFGVGSAFRFSIPLNGDVSDSV